MISELKRTINVEKTMNLLDLNGSKKNFQSEFFVESKDPSKNFLVAVVNQDELDEGKIDFEKSENGKIARKVIFQEDIQKNHFVVLKKDPKDQSPDHIECDIIIKLSDLPPNKQSQLPTQSQSQLPTQSQSQLPTQSQSQLPTQFQSQIPTQFQSQIPTQSQPQIQNDPYHEKMIESLVEDGQFNKKMFFIVGIICVILFLFFFLRKSR